MRRIVIICTHFVGREMLFKSADFFFTAMLQHILQLSRICKKNTNDCNHQGKSDSKIT